MSPKHEKSMMRLVEIYSEEGEPILAKSYLYRLKKILDKKKQNMSEFYELEGDVLMSQKHYDSAYKSFEKSFTENKKNASAINKWGECC